MKDVTAHDLVKYGIIPELIGRLPVITSLSGLDTDALVQILTVPKNSIVQQYKKLFELDNVELVFEDEALKAVAKKAQEQRTGAERIKRNYGGNTHKPYALSFRPIRLLKG